MPRVGELAQIRDPVTGAAKVYVFTGYFGGTEVWEETATGFQIRLTRAERERLFVGSVGPGGS